MKKIFAVCLVVLTGISVVSVKAASDGDDFSMIVAPARYSVLQVAFDILQKRPAVLVSYRGEASTAEPEIYAWNGNEWVKVALKDYREVSFLQRVPSQIILIGDDKTLPTSIAESSTWSPNVIRITTLDTAALLNDSNRAFSWRPSEWEWFAKRYNLKLADESEPLRNSSWYDQPGPLHRDSSEPSAEAPAAPVGDEPVAPVTETPAESAAPAGGGESNDAPTN